ncbi:MAG TPA: hypothetical protein VJN63_11260 [Thermoplasmata archaeon]|nr:hypothetical protein [Thermoplasmata archaeon]
MGRQVGICATQKDVEELLAFLEETADIAVFVSFAPEKERLWVDPTRAPKDFDFKVWNKRFPWTPTYRRVGPGAHDPEMIGWYYVANSDVAPVIEVMRGDMARDLPGRVYWAKDFSAPLGLDYDVEAFSRWYDQISKWIRKHGRKIPKDRWGPHYLPDAWNRRERRTT